VTAARTNERRRSRRIYSPGKSGLAPCFVTTPSGVTAGNGRDGGIQVSANQGCTRRQDQVAAGQVRIPVSPLVDVENQNDVANTTVGLPLQKALRRNLARAYEVVIAVLEILATYLPARSCRRPAARTSATADGAQLLSAPSPPSSTLASWLATKTGAPNPATARDIRRRTARPVLRVPAVQAATNAARPATLNDPGMDMLADVSMPEVSTGRSA
jgi:hypothetical protein